jgi:hypothetical protein
MLKKTMTFPDLDGNDVTEVFWFHINKAELATLELSTKDGLSAHLQAIVDAVDGAEIIEQFNTIIRLAIGRRSEDNKRFIKSPEIAQEFFETEAYSQLFMSIVTDEGAAAEFINGIMPVLVASSDDKDPKLVKSKPDVPLYVSENRRATPNEAVGMSQQELQEAFSFVPVDNDTE